MHAPLLAFVVLGILSCFAGALLLTQPETLGIVLPETIEASAGKVVRVVGFLERYASRT